MGIAELSPHDVVKRLANNPSDEALLQLAEHINNPETEFEARNAIVEHFEASLHTKPVTWVNCIGQQKCQPAEILKPKGLEDLLAAVEVARKTKSQLRAVGSGHSFSNVCPTDGVLLEPFAMNKFLDLDTSVLKDASAAQGLVSVESGITVHDFNNQLDERKLALVNIGAYDGQTLAGAISTGTHGTGLTLGPIASSVRAIVLVASDGIVYQIEPSDGITDPAKFAASGSRYTLKQDDDWFNTTLVAMGCTGLIYSYIVSVVPAFNIQEYRSLRTWDNLKKGLKAGAASSVLTSNDRYEIDMNPYVDSTGSHTCIEITHNNTTRPSSGTRGFLNWVAGFLSSFPGAETLLVWWLNERPKSVVGSIKSAIELLVTPTLEVNGYINKSFTVMNVGGAVNDLKAYAMELSMPCDEHLVDNVDKLLGILNEQLKHGNIMSGPLNLRFVAQSNAYLAPQANRVTCMVELDTLVGVNSSPTLLKEHVKKGMCTPGSGIRVHWGLDLDTVTAEDVKDMYPDFPKWRAVYEHLNKDGMWNSGFTDRLGISIAKNN